VDEKPELLTSIVAATAENILQPVAATTCSPDHVAMTGIQMG